MQVANCLCCGKIYDCRGMTSDVLRFLDRGGACTFCGAQVWCRLGRCASRPAALCRLAVASASLNAGGV
jgi:hypothetical protein